MATVVEENAKPAIIGRSSSHFTRVTRIFAVEMGVDCSFQVVRDLMSSDPADYGGNPALRLPTLQTARGVWFGALNICRELSRQSSLGQRIVWPEDLDQPLLADAQELVLQAMATEVTLVMAKLAGGSDGSAHHAKMRKSLVNTMAWLEANARHALATLPADRDLSYLEVTLFCLVTHLEFRDVLPITSYPELQGFCQQFAARPSADTTTYRFDA
jgi:glutathione S-transferase